MILVAPYFSHNLNIAILLAYAHHWHDCHNQSLSLDSSGSLISTFSRGIHNSFSKYSCFSLN
jgi:hypothetical protein